MTIYAIAPLLSIFIIAFVGVFVFSLNWKHPVNRLFLIVSFANVFFAFTDFHMFSTLDINRATFWLKAQMYWPVILIVQLHFLIVFAKYPVKIKKSWLYIMYTIGLLATYYFIFEVEVGLERNGSVWERLVKEVKLTEQLVQIGFSFSITLLTLVIGLRYIIKSKGRKRKQNILVLMGILTPTLYGVIKESNYDIGAIFIVPISVVVFVSWLFFVLAIWRYRLFNITPEYASEKIISTMKEALLLLDEKGNIVESNRAFHKMFNLKKQEVINYPFENLLNASTFSGLHIKNEYAKSELSNQRFTHINEHGESLSMNFSSSFIRNNSGQTVGYVCVITDITDLEKAQQQLILQRQNLASMAHQAGMAEIASNIMHNIGNILNSINVSSELFFTILNQSKVKELSVINQLFIENRDDLPRFLTQDPKGKMIPEYYEQVAKSLEQDHQELKKEGERLLDKIKMIGESLELHQGQAKTGSFYEPVKIIELMDEVLRILDESFLKNSIDLSKEFAFDKSFVVEVPKSKLLNILVNIIKNAYESVKLNDANNRRIKISITDHNHETLQIDILDNGIGIREEDLEKVFTFGYTTKEHGNGFGLHYCANTLQEMNGLISVKSEGLNKGAVFSVTIPVKQPSQ